MELLSILFLAVFLEGTVNYVIGNKNENSQPREWVKYMTMAAGVLLAMSYNVDIPSMVGLNSTFHFVNYILSGIVIGRGSNYVNEIIGSFTKK